MKKWATAMVLGLASTSVWASDFYYDEKDIYVDDYFAVCADVCPLIEYRLLDSGVAWLDGVINKQVVRELGDSVMTKSGVSERFYKKAQPSDADLTRELNSITQALAMDAKLGMVDSVAVYEFSAYPAYHGHHKGLEMLSVNSYRYTGGAHGLGLVQHFVFDMDKQRALTLDDIIVKGKRQLLEDKLKSAYWRYLRAQDIDPKEHSAYWEFFMTENFTFTRTGLAFIYQPYEIAAYAMSVPKLELDYAALKGIVRDEYLK